MRKAEPRLQWPLRFETTLTESQFSAAALCIHTSQVAYQASGRPRTILEAAAVRGFAAVSGPTLEQVLLDIKEQKGNQRTKRDKVLAVLNAFKSSWNWSEVDVAKCLLAGQEARKRRSMKQADVTGDEEELAQIMAALKKNAAAEAAPASEEADPGQAVAEAVVALRNPERKRSSKGRPVRESVVVTTSADAGKVLQAKIKGKCMHSLARILLGASLESDISKSSVFGFCPMAWGEGGSLRAHAICSAIWKRIWK